MATVPFARAPSERLAEAPLVHGSLSSIARLARAALVSSMPDDPSFVSGEQHEQEGP